MESKDLVIYKENRALCPFSSESLNFVLSSLHQDVPSTPSLGISVAT